jgi:hypothetical protein
MSEQNTASTELTWSKIVKTLADSFREAKIKPASDLNDSLIPLRKWAAPKVYDRLVSTLEGDALEAAMKEIATPLMQYTMHFLSSENKARAAAWTSLKETVPEFALLVKSKAAWNKIAKAEYEISFGTKCMAK